MITSFNEWKKLHEIGVTGQMPQNTTDMAALDQELKQLQDQLFRLYERATEPEVKNGLTQAIDHLYRIRWHGPSL